METSTIDLLNTLFIICLTCTIVFLLISVLLFFVFDIRSIFNMKTGRAKAKTIKEMKKANANTGRLRVDGKTMTSKLSKEEISKGRVPAVIPPEEHGGVQPDQAASYPPQSHSGSDAAQTSVLEAADTSVLSQPAPQTTTPVGEFAEYAQKIHFAVLKEDMYIHTDVVI